MPSHEMPSGDTPIPSPPSLLLVFAVWLGIGAQSFGGGQATLALMRGAVVEHHHWIGEDEFARALTLCQIAPGMNLIALTVLLGRRTRGPMGIVVALFGLLLPSVGLTLLITAFFGRLRTLPGVAAALQNGVVPAVVGIGAWNSWKTGLALLRGEDKGSTAFGALLVLGSAAVSLWLSVPVFVILLAGALLGLTAALIRARQKKRVAAS